MTKFNPMFNEETKKKQIKNRINYYKLHPEEHPAKRPEEKVRLKEVALRLQEKWKEFPELDPRKRPEVRKKMSQSGKKYYATHPPREFTIETRQKIGKARSDYLKLHPNEHPMKSESAKAKLREHHPMKNPIIKQKMIATLQKKMRGDKNPNWNGGSSFYPYCPLFNDEYRNRIRIDFGNKCLLCERTNEENLVRFGRALNVHHIHYDKEVGCNGHGMECVPLCFPHHNKTNPIKYREWWVAYFEQHLWNIFGWKLETQLEWCE